MAMSDEQQEKLAKIEEAGGKDLTPAQKAVMIKFGTIDIKAKKPAGDMTIPPLEKSGGGSSAFDPKPVEAMPKDRK
jgi:hypothetical protein